MGTGASEIEMPVPEKRVQLEDKGCQLNISTTSSLSMGDISTTYSFVIYSVCIICLVMQMCEKHQE